MTAAILDFAAIRKRMNELENPQAEEENVVTWPECEPTPDIGAWRVVLVDTPLPDHWSHHTRPSPSIPKGSI